MYKKRKDDNKKVREIFREWSKREEQIMIKARSSRKWKSGLDDNNDLFKGKK